MPYASPAAKVGVPSAPATPSDGQCLRLQQRQEVLERHLLPDVGVVARQPVLEAGIAAEQVEGVLLVLEDGGLRELLAFGPDIVQARARQVLLRAGEARVRIGLRVFDLAEVVVAADAGDQLAVVDLARNAARVDGVLRLGLVIVVRIADARGVDDRDLADAVLRRVDPVDDELVVAVVRDVDTGVAVSRLDEAAAACSGSGRPG